MPDHGHELTDEMLRDLERRIAGEYAKAAREMQRKYEKYMEQFKAGMAKQKELLDAGSITQKDYNDWVYRHTMVTKRWEEMRDVLATDLQHTHEIAMKMAKDQMPDIYALNHNYGVYDIEHGGKINTGLSLYNHDTAEYLLGDQRQLMPGPSTRKAAEIAANKAMQWDKQKIQSAVLQGVLQGESPHDVATRLQGVAQMEYNAAVRYARTMGTSAQNAGRYQSYRRAKRLGVDLTIEWEATLDDRTRNAHRQMHGQRTDVDKPFHTPDGYTIFYPADCSGSSDAPQKEIWNCRCTLLAWVKGFEHDKVTSSPKMGDMSFEEWQEAHADYDRRGGGSSDSNHETDIAWGAPQTMSQDQYSKWQNEFSSDVQFTRSFQERYGMTPQEAADSFDRDPESGKWLDEIGRQALDTLESPYQSYGAGYVANADGSRAINKYLRKGEVGRLYKKDEMQSTIDAMKELISATTVPNNMVVDRWVHAGVLEKMGIDIGKHGKPYRIGHAFCIDGLDHEMIANNVRENLVGAIITDNGFMSASACSELNVFQGSDVKFSIMTPKGMHAFITNNTRESEIVFSPGMKQRVKDVRIIEAEAFDHEHNPTKRKCIEILLEFV